MWFEHEETASIVFILIVRPALTMRCGTGVGRFPDEYSKAHRVPRYHYGHLL